MRRIKNGNAGGMERREVDPVQTSKHRLKGKGAKARRTGCSPRTWGILLLSITFFFAGHVVAESTYAIEIDALIEPAGTSRIPYNCRIQLEFNREQYWGVVKWHNGQVIEFGTDGSTMIAVNRMTDGRRQLGDHYAYIRPGYFAHDGYYLGQAAILTYWPGRDIAERVAGPFQFLGAYSTNDVIADFSSLDSSSPMLNSVRWYALKNYIPAQDSDQGRVVLPYEDGWLMAEYQLLETTNILGYDLPAMFSISRFGPHVTGTVTGPDDVTMGMKATFTLLSFVKGGTRESFLPTIEADTNVEDWRFERRGLPAPLSYRIEHAAGKQWPTVEELENRLGIITHRRSARGWVWLLVFLLLCPPALIIVVKRKREASDGREST